jgi:hypothetical protein
VTDTDGPVRGGESHVAGHDDDDGAEGDLDDESSLIRLAERESMTAPLERLYVLGYGVSLVLFVLALRNLGVARTGAYFSMAPFAGAVLALPLLGETPGPLFWLAALLMGIGIGLHLTERHEHEHRHEEVRHSHRHVHDAHHRHAHDVDWSSEPHTHEHLHEATSHAHPHFPDAHHRHDH